MRRCGPEEKHISDPEALKRPRMRGQDWVHGRFKSFVRVPIDSAWALVSDAERMPEWEQMTDDIASESAGGGAWIVIAPTHRSDRTPIKVKPEFRRRRVTQTEALSPSRVIWWFEYPDVPEWEPRMLAVELAPTEGGTFVTLTSTWRRVTGWRRAVGWPLRPLQRFFVWRSLAQMGKSISRALR